MSYDELVQLLKVSVADRVRDAHLDAGFPRNPKWTRDAYSAEIALERHGVDVEWPLEIRVTLKESGEKTRERHLTQNDAAVSAAADMIVEHLRGPRDWT